MAIFIGLGDGIVISSTLDVFDIMGVLESLDKRVKQNVIDNITEEN